MDNVRKFWKIWESNKVDIDLDDDDPIVMINHNLTAGLIAMFATAMVIMAVSYLIFYPGGMIGWVAGVLVATSQTTGIADFNSLYAGFSAAMVIMLFFLMYFVYVVIPKPNEPHNEYNETMFKKLIDRQLEQNKMLAELVHNVEYLYEEACVKEFSDIEQVTDAKA